MKKFSLLFIGLLGMCFLAAQEKYNYLPPKGYVIYRTNETMKMDGKANEAAWKNAPWTDYFVDIEGSAKPTPRYTTRIKMLWDDTNIYFYAELQDPHVWADIKERDAVIFRNNDFEIFVTPDMKKTHYGEFEVNALGTFWDLLLTNAYRSGGNVINNWDIKGLTLGVDIQGTLNNPKDVDKGWHLEIAYPWKALDELGKHPKDGDQWRINFSRVEWQYQLNNGVYARKVDDQGKPLPEDNWVWSPQGVIAMHQPESWGYIQFSTQTSGVVPFNRPKDEAMEQTLFYLFRLQLKQYAKTKTYASTTRELIGTEALIVNGNVLKAIINPTFMGYEITIEKDGHSYGINEEGRILTK